MIADYQALTNTKIMVFGKRAGTTSLYVLDTDENVIYSATVKVSHNVEELNGLIKNEFPDALVSAESIAGKLFLKGKVPTPSMAEKIIRLAEGYVSQPQMSKGKKGGAASDQSKEGGSATKSGAGKQASSGTAQKNELINQLNITMSTQVNLRVRIAEVSRNVSNKLGIKWGSQGVGTGKLNFVDSLGWGNLAVMVDALSTNGMISVLAEPNLTAMSGESASFLVGGQVPIPLIYGDTAVVEYKSFGVRLDFKPTVLSPNRISLQIEPEVSTLSSSTSLMIADSSLPIFTIGFSPEERIITIEDAAELKLAQPHVIRIETRPANTEGLDSVDQRLLLKNALRMRPDRIILGEVRGAEAFDMMQAMNTGHDGSMCTLHANSPLDALIRLENMLLMAEVNLPATALRRQIAGTIDIIVQIERMRDGLRRVTHITEVVGLEGEQYLTRDLFSFDYQGQSSQGNVVGQFVSGKIVPDFIEKARYYQLETRLKQVMGVN